MPLSTGDKLGPYEILAPIGAGGMGQVYRARDTRLGREVAIKILPESFAGREPRERFQREARASSSLSHPNICATYDVGESDGQPFLVMELLEGETLRKRIAAGPMDTHTVLDLGIQIADALEVQTLTASKPPERAQDLRECVAFCGDAVSQWSAMPSIREEAFDRTGG